MRRIVWNQNGRQAELLRAASLRAANPLRGSPRRKPRLRDELLALAKISRVMVRSGTRIEWLGPRQWRLVTSDTMWTGDQDD